MACRAIFTAFSTASAPELNSAERLSCVPGVRLASSSQTSTYPSYGVTMKQVWVNLAACSATRADTRGAALPTETTAIPDPKSIRELPSASTITPPPASVTNTGRTWLTPRATARSRRASSSRETGPGISVTSCLCCGTRASSPGTCSVINQTIDHLSRRLKRRWLSARDLESRVVTRIGERTDLGHA